MLLWRLCIQHPKDCMKTREVAHTGKRLAHEENKTHLEQEKRHPMKTTRHGFDRRKDVT